MLEDIRLAFQGIWNHKLRSALTMLGIIIGIGSIIAIVSTIKGTNEQIKKNLVGAGNDAVNVQLYQGDWVRKDTKPDPNDFYGDSKLQAEKGLKGLQCNTFKVAIIRPPMIYGPGNKGNLPRLGWLAQKTPVFPAWHNKRSMLHVVNLAEFVKQITVREMSGTFFPQNAEYADTVEIVRLFAKEHGHKVWISRLFNPLVWLGAKFLPAIPKMFSDSYYVQEMSKMDFDYQVISFEESLKGLEIRKTMH